MTDFNRNHTSPFGEAAGRVDAAAAIDAGLRTHMLRIYNYMTLGLAITGFVALGVYMAAITSDPANAVMQFKGLMLTAFGQAIFFSWLKWVVVFAPVIMVFVFAAKLENMAPAKAHVMFWVFSALMGASLSSIFLVYTHTSIVRVFFLTAASFGALSLYGYTTRRDMTALGSFLFMGLIGLLGAILINLFVQSTMLQFVISVVGVLVFAGLTAWDTQQLKNEYIYNLRGGGDVAERAAISGALRLYLDFINLFIMLLHLFGGSRE